MIVDTLTRALGVGLMVAGGLAGFPAASSAQERDQPSFLKDRETGQPTSMFGTYIRRGELLIYPFVEGYVDRNKEYTPSEFGYGLETDQRGRYRAFESLLFVGYGATDWLAVELEASVIKARLTTDPNDPTGIPDRFEESGIGDIEGQLRLRLLKERAGRPEVFSYFEAVAPNGRDKRLIGTPDWEYKFGAGLVKGSRHGTFTFRFAGEYSAEESALATGEYAVEYLKRLSPSLRLYLGIEGNQDEVELINEVQWHLNDRVFLKLNNAFGLTSKATDWAPEIGVMFAFPLRQNN